MARSATRSTRPRATGPTTLSAPMASRAARPTAASSARPRPNSVDLIQAYKVMSGTTFLTAARYWVEMARVTRVGGYAVFDIVTEECLDPDTVERWAVSDLETGSYPAVIPRCVALDFFAGKGFRLAGSFFVPMGLGTTETFVFERTTPVRRDPKAAA